MIFWNSLAFSIYNSKIWLQFLTYAFISTIHSTYILCESEVAQSCPTLCNPMDCSSPGCSIHGMSWQECWSGLHVLLQGIFLSQGLNMSLPCLLCWRWILYCWATGETLVLARKTLKADSCTVCIVEVLHCYCSVAQSCLTLCDPCLQHARLPCPSPSPTVGSNSLSQWCHPTISTSVIPFFSRL